MNSNFLRLNLKDAIKGIVVAIITSVLTGIYNLLLTENPVFSMENLKPILLVGLAAGVSYFIKNFLTNSNNQMFTSEPKPQS